MPDEHAGLDPGESSASGIAEPDQATMVRDGADDIATHVGAQSGRRDDSSQPSSADEQSAKRDSPGGLGGSGCFKAGCVILVVVLVAVVGFVYYVSISLFPDSGPEGARVRRIANAANEHLSNSPEVVSTTITDAKADISGTEAYLDVRLKDDTSADAVADLLASTHDAAFGKNSSDTNIYLGIGLSWTLHGTSVDILASGSHPSDRAFIGSVLATAGEARTIDDNGVDYGQVTAIPASFQRPGKPSASKTFTLNGWEVTVESNPDGQVPTTVAFDQLITAARRAGPTGTIDLDGTTLSVTGLVTDDSKDLTPEAAAPVVHTVADCNAAGLTTLQLNGKLQKGLSSDDEYWLTFTCNNGTWTPHHGGNTGKDEAAILQKAAEL